MNPCESHPQTSFTGCAELSWKSCSTTLANPGIFRVWSFIMLVRGICESLGVNVHPVIFISLILLLGAQAEVDGKILKNPIPTSVLEMVPVELFSSKIGKEISRLKHMGSQSAPHSGEELLDSETQSEVLLHKQQTPSSTPDFADNQTMPTRKKPPSLKQLNIARKRLRPQVIPTISERLVDTGSSLLSSASLSSISSDVSHVLKDLTSETREAKEHIPEFPLWINRRRHSGSIPRHPFQLAPYTAQPSTPHNQDSVKLSLGDLNTSLQADEPFRTHYADRDLNAGEENQDTTTSTIITTTVITTEQSPVQCSVNFFEPEGYIDSTDYPPLPFQNYLQCAYNITVYMGYGVELQVKSVNLSEGEHLSIRGISDDGLVVLANETLLVEGQVIRSPTNSLSVYFKTLQDDSIGTFHLHYQVFMLSCSFPRRPDNGDVTVMDLHAGGMAHFHCYMGYELEGSRNLTCINSSKPRWSDKEPICLAPCGGRIQNATVGRVLSPNFPSNYSNNLFCAWTIDAPGGQKLHLHFEKFILAEKDRLAVYSNGKMLFDSVKTETVSFEGLISEGSCIRIEFSTDETKTAPGFNIRFEAFERGHCYEPYIQNGNFTTTDPTYSMGTVVEFTCDPGHSLEQGPSIIECINMKDPYWNDTEPLCRAMCGGELSTPAGVILSPNWPDLYTEGEDCIWRIHVGDDRRIFLDIQLMNLSNNDILTIYDGDEITSKILGQFVGSSGPQKLYSSSPDLSIQFHSDPAGMIFGKGQGFILNYIEVSRNDSCSELPEIQNGWKTTSHTDLVRGAKITYQCDPGYDIVGSETLTCQWDLSWSSDPPFCEKIMYCTDPGEVDHSTRLISDPVLLVGTTIQYTCDTGFVLEGSSLLTCYSRETGTPIWTSKIPHCVSEESLACDNPGLPENGYQILYKRLYLPGESLTFMCYEGFELMGEVTIKCILGQPSQWSGPLPVCKATQDRFEHALQVAEAAAETSLEGGNMALAIFIPVVIISILLGGAYIYITRCRYYSSLRLPLMYSHPYSQITVETEFDNPIYETGETREYEVSI
ncbi:seizure 6-like protein [Rana temporaria]|uniref:seizure 6-like protein n=1 Tax=Rana temporaria TaxID=8407 RepID=UPI001AAD94E8|nr:seizure 6-like protein [Rana temporaria]